jgi:hypothetical protein
MVSLIHLDQVISTVKEKTDISKFGMGPRDMLLKTSGLVFTRILESMLLRHLVGQEDMVIQTLLPQEVEIMHRSSI